MAPEFGKILILAGFALVGVGLLFSVGGHVPWLGRLPGDIVVKKENFSFYFPVVTCIIVSAVLTLVFYLFRR